MIFILFYSWFYDEPTCGRAISDFLLHSTDENHQLHATNFICWKFIFRVHQIAFLKLQKFMSYRSHSTNKLIFVFFFRSILSSSFWAFSLYNMSVYVCDYVCLSKSDNKRLGANAFSYYHLFILFIFWEKNRSSWQITFWQDFVGSVYCKITMRLKIFRPFCSAFSHSHINNRKTVFELRRINCWTLVDVEHNLLSQTVVQDLVAIFGLFDTRWCSFRCGQWNFLLSFVPMAETCCHVGRSFHDKTFHCYHFPLKIIYIFFSVFLLTLFSFIFRRNRTIILTLFVFW